MKNDAATTEIYTLTLHDALPISPVDDRSHRRLPRGLRAGDDRRAPSGGGRHAGGLHPQRRRVTLRRSEEHTSELQSRQYLVCRLLLEKKTESPTSALRSRPYSAC